MQEVVVTSLRSVRILCAALVCGALTPGGAPGQTANTQLENVLRQFNGDLVKGYMQPVADLFGANMNSGFFHSAAIPTSGFRVSFDIVAMGAMVGDDQKTYNVALPEDFSQPSFRSATFFGPRGSVFRDPRDTNLVYQAPDGVLDATLFPFGIPQLRFGYLYGTEATIRFIPLPAISDQIPSSTLVGIGVRHSLSQYFPLIPVDLSVGFVYNSFETGDIIDFKGTAFGIQASRKFSVLTLYGGLALERSTLHLKFTANDPVLGTAVVETKLNGKNSARFTGGFGLTFGFFTLFADANVGQIVNFSGGMGFGI